MIAENLAERILLRRRERGLRQEDIAKALEVSRSTYINLEHKPENLKLIQVRYLMTILQVPVEFFIDEGIE